MANEKDNVKFSLIQILLTTIPVLGTIVVAIIYNWNHIFPKDNKLQVASFNADSTKTEIFKADSTSVKNFKINPTNTPTLSFLSADTVMRRSTTYVKKLELENNETVALYSDFFQDETTQKYLIRMFFSDYTYKFSLIGDDNLNEFRLQFYSITNVDCISTKLISEFEGHRHNNVYTFKPDSTITFLIAIQAKKFFDKNTGSRFSLICSHEN